MKLRLSSTVDDLAEVRQDRNTRRLRHRGRRIRRSRWACCGVIAESCGCRAGVNDIIARRRPRLAPRGFRVRRAAVSTIFQAPALSRAASQAAVSATVCASGRVTQPGTRAFVQSTSMKPPMSRRNSPESTAAGRSRARPCVPAAAPRRSTPAAAPRRPRRQISASTSVPIVHCPAGLVALNVPRPPSSSNVEHETRQGRARRSTAAVALAMPEPRPPARAPPADCGCTKRATQ